MTEASHSESWKPGWREVWLLSVILALLLPRAYVILQSPLVLIDSDEAIVGLMARHMLQGEFPIWQWGINYVGTLDVVSTAVFFKLFGATPFVLKLEATFWFCAFLSVQYLLAREVADRVTARFSTLVLAASPAFLAIWSLVAPGAYMSTLFLGTLGLLITVRILRDGLSFARAAVLGFVLGLAFWTFLLSITFTFPILAILLLKFGKRLFSRNGWVLGLAFMLGSLPFWAFNIRHRFAGLFIRDQLRHDYASFGTAFSGFMKKAVPILLGTRPAHGTFDFFPLGSLVGALIFVAAVVVCLRLQLNDFRKHSAINGRLLLLTVLGWTVFLFAASGFGYNADEPRYLIPLYAVFYILLLVGLDRRLQLALVILLLAINLNGTLRPTLTTLATPLNAEPNGELIAFLQSHHVRTAFAPYWIAYRLTFESNEQILCTPPQNDFVRYAPYLDMARSDPAAAFIRLNPPQYEPFQVPIKPPAGYSLNRVGNFDVFLAP